jgi:hypothetical protein
MGAASGEGLSSAGVYAELVDLAMGMHRPQLVYTFLAAVASHEAWRSSALAKRCVQHTKTLSTAAGRATSSTIGAAADCSPDGVSDEAWALSGDLLPRLYCLRFDPNPHSRQVMRRLWDTLLPGRPRQQRAVARRWGDVIGGCLARATSGGKWREREAALEALSELSGRGGDDAWAALGPWVEPLWQCALGGLDDVRESAKAAALLLAKEVLRLTARLSLGLLMGRPSKHTQGGAKP